MKKRVKRKNRANPKKTKKHLPFKLLLLSFAVLFILLFIYFVLYGNRELVSEGNKDFGLSNIKAFQENPMIVSVVNYNQNNASDSLDIILERNNAEGILQAVSINFIGSGNQVCEYLLTQNLPSLNEQKTYNIPYSQINGCGGIFFQITDISSIALSDVNLTQTQNIPSVVITKGVYYPNFIDLDNYFSDLEGLDEINFSYELTSGQNDILLDFNSAQKTIGFNSSNNSLSGDRSIKISLGYPGLYNSYSNVFSLTVNEPVCYDSDVNSTYPDGKNKFVSGNVNNFSENHSDSCYSNQSQSVLEYFCYQNNSIDKSIILCGSNEYCQNGRCILNGSVNHKPDFLSYKCGNINLRANEVSVIDLNECFEDDENDNLNFRISSEPDSNNIEAEIEDGDILHLIPHDDWTGSARIYIGANDSKEEQIAKINILVQDPIHLNTGQQNPLTNNELEDSSFVIENAFPSRDNITILSNQIVNFSIGNDYYDDIIWSVDGKEIDNQNIFYVLDKPKIGKLTLEVVIKKGEKAANKVWSISVVKDNSVEFALDAKNILFYTIVLVVLIIIFLVIWMLVRGFGKGQKKDDNDSEKLNLFIRPPAKELEDKPKEKPLEKKKGEKTKENNAPEKKKDQDNKN